jgi:hypothetical protein
MGKSNNDRSREVRMSVLLRVGLTLIGEFGCFTQMCECSLKLVFAHVGTLCIAETVV